MQQYQQALLQQQVLPKQLPPQKHSPEFLASPQEFSPALMSHSKSFPAHVGAALDTSYSTTRQASSIDIIVVAEVGLMAVLPQLHVTDCYGTS